MPKCKVLPFLLLQVFETNQNTFTLQYELTWFLPNYHVYCALKVISTPFQKRAIWKVTSDCCYAGRDGVTVRALVRANSVGVELWN